MDALTGTRLDHLVVAAATLEQGAAWLEARLGVPLDPGGRHDGFGTHNRLLRLDGDPIGYLELIAPDPETPDPTRLRPFALDDPAVRAALAERPRLLTWVARTDDLEAARLASPVDLGEPVAMRRGELSWRILLPGDGRLHLGGTLPHLIRWPDGPHPLARLPERGVGLLELTLRHPDPERLRGALAALGLAETPTVEAGESGLEARFRTPGGEVLLD